MARCEKCLQHGLPALCENADEGPDQRTCHTGRSSEIILPGNIAHCQIEPVLPILAKMLKAAPGYHPSRRRPCPDENNCSWVKTAMSSWRPS